MFADIHSHILFETDDGPKTKEEMFALVDATYAEGTRSICLTPHYHPGYYGNNDRKADSAYEILREYCSQRYPDLILAQGNELHYEKNCLSWLNEGKCKTLNNTRYVLVDFNDKTTKDEIIFALSTLLGKGYLPILAHAERYSALKCSTIRKLKQKGVLIQTNAQSPFGLFGLAVAMRAKKMLSLELTDFISSDCHSIKGRPPYMHKCYNFIKSKQGAEYADYVCKENATALIFTKAIVQKPVSQTESDTEDLQN